jgi:proline iminopeptidase
MKLRSVAAGLALASVAPRPSTGAEGFLAGADGVRLYHRLEGKGPDTVVFLHGGPGSNFRGSGDELTRLARGRRFVLYDQRGSGRSELVTDPARLTARHHVEDLEALRRQLGSERISLVGLSWGAGLAALYAEAHPERVERLVLISPMSPTRGLFEERLVALAAVRGERTAARFKEIVGRVAQAGDAETLALCRESIDLAFPAYLVRPTREALRKAARRCDIAAAAIRNRPVVEAATLGSLGQWDLRPLLGRLQVPALVMEGVESRVPLEPTREWARVLPRARLLLVPDAGHEVFLDQPDAVLQAIDRFLAGRDPAQAPTP